MVSWDLFAYAFLCPCDNHMLDCAQARSTSRFVIRGSCIEGQKGVLAVMMISLPLSLAGLGINLPANHSNKHSRPPS